MKDLELGAQPTPDYQKPLYLGTEVIRGAAVSVKEITWTLQKNKRTILHKMSLDILPGRILGVVGPNGAGKSTLLRLLYRYHRPSSGTVEIDGIDIWKMTARTAACKVAAVLQEQPTDFALTVREIVYLGRTPHHIGFGGSAGKNDELIVDAALHRLDLDGFASRSLGTLSGGERQRVMVARALAQEPSVLVLDEPTNHLDIRHQLEILKLIQDLPLTIITSLHDLNMASEICDEVVMLKDGHVLGCGIPNDVFSAEAISYTFEVAASHERIVPSDKNVLTFNLQT